MVQATSLPEAAPVRSRPTGLTDEDRATLITARMAAQRRKGMRMLALGGLIMGLALLLYVAGQFL